MHNKYYSRFQILTHSLFWKRYLNWAYTNCVKDLNKLKFTPDFSQKNFTALLCGTSGEITSSVFVNFVLSKNNKAKIIILDISETQLKKSKDMLMKKFPMAKIKYVKADAKRTFLEDESIDYIETDGFFEYFSHNELILLLDEWQRILKKNGFVTTRAFASSSFLGKIIDKIRVFIGKNYLGVKLNIYHLKDITELIKRTKFNFVQGGGAFCPTYKRFSLIKKQSKTDC